MPVQRIKTVFQGVTSFFAVQDAGRSVDEEPNASERQALAFAEWYKARSNDAPTSYPRRITATELYEAYCTWCEDRAVEPASLPAFAQAASTIFDKYKQGGRVYYELRFTPNSLS